VQIFSISSSHDDAHDGCAACIADGELIFSVEAEKDSGPRYAGLSEEFLLRTLSKMHRLPDVLVQSGWGEEYLGLGTIARTEVEFFKTLSCWRTTHERAHILCAYGLSPFPQGQPCYVLVWEGTIGRFYRVDENLNIEPLGSPLSHPGHRYQTLWALANAGIGYWHELSDHERPQHAESAFLQILSHIAENLDGPGKLMALSAFARPQRDGEENIGALVESLLTMNVDELVIHEPRTWLSPVFELLSRWEPFRHMKVEDQTYKNIIHQLTGRIYDAFFQFAISNLKEGLPLLISGGCGLNCTWNTNWKESGLFPEVFVPPCTGDCGIAIGAGIDAQHRFTGNAKVRWSVMAGEEFVLDAHLQDRPGFVFQELNYKHLSYLLARRAVVGWVQGKYEMGPRALGHRSILAAPFDSAIHARLNRIKKREFYRPIAPICLEEDVDKHFHWNGPSPYMLHFQKLKTDQLKAVTHVDGTARVQTVNERDDARTYRLLREFKQQTDFGVLCNTSLNLKGRGFINRSSDLMRFAEQEDLDVVVINDDMLIKQEVFAKHLDSNAVAQ
jgi:hydroxymethyl cephem carbamoyltransferase